MTRSKALGPNKVINKFYKIFWKLIKVDYLEMIMIAIRDQYFLLEVTYGIVSLFFKSEI